MEKKSKIYVSGHKGLVGSALVRKLKKHGYVNLITRGRKELDLTRQADVETFFQSERPEYVFLAAAKVGGVHANNTFPADFIYINLVIQTNIIHAAWKTGVRRLLFLGSSCIYPRECPQPMKEEHLLTSPLEPTNEPYAIAKIAGIKMCQSYNRQYKTNYLAAMPTNLYGSNDNFDLETSHVLPALMRKIHIAKYENRKTSSADNKNSTVEIWGTGKPRREFLHVDDLADASFFIMNLEDRIFNSLKPDNEAPLINVGYGEDITIKELALLINKIIGYEGQFRFNPDKPDGTMQKMLDVSKIKQLGWEPKISLKNGIQMTYEWCKQNKVFN